MDNPSPTLSRLSKVRPKKSVLPAGWGQTAPRISEELLEEIPPEAVSAAEILHGLEEDSDEAIVRWLPNGTRIGLNAAYARRYGCLPHALIGRNLLAQLTDGQRAKLKRQLEDLTPEEPVWVEQKPALTPLGKQTWQEWVTRGFFDKAGKLVELQSLGRDITMRKDLSLAMDEIARSLLNIRGSRYFEHHIFNTIE